MSCLHSGHNSWHAVLATPFDMHHTAHELTGQGEERLGACLLQSTGMPGATGLLQGNPSCTSQVLQTRQE